MLNYSDRLTADKSTTNSTRQSIYDYLTEKNLWGSRERPLMSTNSRGGDPTPHGGDLAIS